ncbi:MAG: SDR family oxidoreductase [Myxococcota bacterium]|nr:SDR family oxidoreductase [Myxococcota bacterium]
MSPNLKPISDQIMVVTGASSGIGLATALTAAKRGAKVVLAARSGETLADIAAQIESIGGQAIAVVADVARREDVERIAHEAIAQFGRIDTWVNDAGVSIYGRLDEVSEEDSRRLFDINFWGVVHGSLVALPFLRESNGALINVGSEVSEAVVPLQGMYSASKHAVKGFTDALRVETEAVDKAGVAITLIQPTAVDTPYPQHAKNYMNQEPKLPDPLIDPQEVADAILLAATTHKRDIKVGALATVNTMMAKIAPCLGDAMSAKQVDRQQYAEPPRNPEGTLHRPGESGAIRGTGPLSVNGEPQSTR